ncbi:hypothetical protein [Pseudochryseolinea flava]|uniref:Uncharacterized protein n=1 Tax=Pseudochryseolinea flava TaxID=2059302 RepID=A0A364Y1Q6_9BACT|nr:hypothetical protein [Pseudochryseolinea flava]RAW00668.1 hypothetical protein DQQ10_13850 [Pseudochryseolinea flava]
MKSIEYQVGNWVKRPQSVEDFFVSPMFEDQIKTLQTNDSALFSKPDDRGNGSVPLFQLRGIPLTDQWFVRLGFENKSDDTAIIWRKVAPGMTMFDILQRHGDSRIFSINFKKVQIPVQYVHQLQNLYKGLAGEELIQDQTL